MHVRRVWENATVLAHTPCAKLLLTTFTRTAPACLSGAAEPAAGNLPRIGTRYGAEHSGLPLFSDARVSDFFLIENSVRSR